jgi:hypothetical protein
VHRYTHWNNMSWWHKFRLVGILYLYPARLAYACLWLMGFEYWNGGLRVFGSDADRFPLAFFPLGHQEFWCHVSPRDTCQRACAWAGGLINPSGFLTLRGYRKLTGNRAL